MELHFPLKNVKTFNFFGIQTFNVGDKSVEISITEMIQLYGNIVEISHKPIYMGGKKAVFLAP